MEHRKFKPVTPVSVMPESDQQPVPADVLAYAERELAEAERSVQEWRGLVEAIRAGRRA